ncbi:MAG TPA: helix-turn-helix transcriptional regulator [Blastocatellia bacterium]|nr:helix-turn-helix transcriptional regulator [Blastocatellia bacterium]
MAGPNSSEQVNKTYLGEGQYIGKVVGSRRCCDLFLAEVQHTCAKKNCEHSHELAFFSVLLDGSYTERQGNKLIDYKQLGVVYRQPWLVHSDQIGNAGVRLFNVELKQSWMERANQYGRIRDLSPNPHRGELAWLAARLYREFRDQDLCSSLAIEGLVLEMLSVLFRGSSTTDKQVPIWLSKVNDILHAEFRDNISASRIAEEVGVHPFYLSKMFRKFNNQTIAEYVQNLRVEYASREMLKPDADLATVALSSGFADQSHLTRIFKRVTGMTPGAFRATFIQSRFLRPWS